jgi:uncharacterized protein YbjT (DUF2867 family)
VVLVIGGSSKTGSALIEQSQQRGQRIRALARASEDGLRAGVEAVTGGLGDPGSLERAMDGVEKGVLLASPRCDAVRWHSNAIDPARGARVQLLVRSSTIGVDSDSEAQFVNVRVVSDGYLDQSGVLHVGPQPTRLFQCIPESMIPTIDEAGSFCDDVLVGLCCDYRSSRADGYGASLSGTFECAGKPAGSLDQLVAGVQR